MSDLRINIKSILRPLYNAFFRQTFDTIKKRRLRSNILKKLKKVRGQYNFSKEDVQLYVDEIYTQMPVFTKLKDEESTNTLDKIIIKEVEIYWPRKLTDKDLPWLYHEIFDDFNINPSSYDHPAMDFENRKWVMDAGAAEGYFSVFSLCKSDATVIAIEPLALMKTALEKTLNLYAKGKETIVVSAALADKPGVAEFKIDYEHICDSGLSSKESVQTVNGNVNLVTENVAITTIDQLADQYSLGEAGMIKMDIEGFEMSALSAATNLMKNYKPNLAIAIYHDLENAVRCAEIIKTANPNYKVEFRGYYGYFEPPRPYMLFAH